MTKLKKKSNGFHHLALTISAMLLLTSCAHLFSSRYQKVTFECATKGSKVIFPDEGIKQKNGINKFDKRTVFHVVTVEKEGYKSSKYAFGLTKRSPTLAFAILDLAVPLLGWVYGIGLDFKSPKTKKYDKIQKVPELVPYDKRKTDEKFMIVNNTATDAKAENIKWLHYDGLKKYKKYMPKESLSAQEGNNSNQNEDLKIDNTIFTEALNVSLKKMNFIDTTNSVFPSIGNTLYLNAKVKKITLNDVRSNSLSLNHTSSKYFHNHLLSVELEIEWEALDYYKQKIFSSITIENSDHFLFDYASDNYRFENFIKDAMQDNLEYSLIKIRKEISQKGLLKIATNVKETPLAAISIPKPQISNNSRINDYMKSAVTVKVDDGHGSGAIISADGYIITAFHVVVGMKKIEVIFNDSS